MGRHWVLISIIAYGGCFIEMAYILDYSTSYWHIILMNMITTQIYVFGSLHRRGIEELLECGEDLGYCEIIYLFDKENGAFCSLRLYP